MIKKLLSIGYEFLNDVVVVLLFFLLLVGVIILSPILAATWVIGAIYSRFC